jgi:hypothetical protein
MTLYTIRGVYAFCSYVTESLVRWSLYTIRGYYGLK